MPKDVVTGNREESHPPPPESMMNSSFIELGGGMPLTFHFNCPSL